MEHPDPDFPATAAALSLNDPSRPRLEVPGVAELYRKYRSELCRYVTRTFGRGPPEPEDVVQSAFARYAALVDPGAVENPRAFLYRTAHNVAVEHFRHEATRSRHDSSIVIDSGFTDELDGERVLLARERYRILHDTIERMDTRRRTLLIMNRVHELSFAEIARRTGMSQTQVKRLVADAIVQCNEVLERALPGGCN